MAQIKVTRTNGSDTVAESLDDFRIRCDHEITTLKLARGWTDADCRVNPLLKLRNAAQSALAFRSFQRDIFPTQDYWTIFFDAVPTPADFRNFHFEAGVFIGFGFFQGTASIFESEMRVLVRKIDPTACSGGTATFQGAIMPWLLARATTVTGWTDFLTFLGAARNTIHNNGAFYPTSGNAVSVAWKGTQYDFVPGAAPNFMGWPTLILIANELVTFCVEIANDPAIVALPA